MAPVYPRLFVAVAACITIFAASSTANANTIDAEGTQEIAVTEPIPAGLAFRSLGLAEGLPSAQITDVVQDSNGFIWFGTLRGLARYDGAATQVYSPNSPKAYAMPSAFVTDLATDANGGIWVATGDAGLTYIKDAQVQHNYNTADSTLGFDGIVRVHASADGTVLACSDDGHLLLAGPAASAGAPRTFEDIGDSFGQCTSFTSLPEGRVVMGTDSGLYLGVPKDRSFQPVDSIGLESLLVTSLLHDPATKNLWVGTDTGICLTDASKEQWTFRCSEAASRGDAALQTHVTSFALDKDARLWVGTRSGLLLMTNPTNFAFTAFTKDSERPVETQSFPDVVSGLLVDREGSLWMGTHSIGVRMATRSHLLIQSYTNADLTDGTGPFAEAKDGKLWAGIFGQGLGIALFDFKKGTYTRWPAILTAEGESVEFSGWITSLFLDSRGILWVGGDDHGLIGLRFETGEVWHFPYSELDDEGIPTPRVESMAEVGGNLALGTWGSGVVLFNPIEGTFRKLGDLPSEYVSVVENDITDPTKLVVAMHHGGVVRLSTGNGDVAPLPLGKFAEASVDGLLQDINGDIWLGFQDSDLGVVRKGGTFEHIVPFPNLPGRTVYEIAKDDRGLLWLTTAGKGLVLFDPETSEVRNFTKADGMVGDEHIQHGLFQGTDNLLYTAVIGGFSRVSQSVLRSLELPIQKPLITKVKVLGNEIPLPPSLWTGGTLDLSYSDSVVSFQLAPLSFRKRPVYSYRVKGLHDWIETEQQELALNNLPDGEHPVEVRLMGSVGSWSEPLSFTLRVAPPLWRTWYAYSAYGLIVILIGLLIRRQLGQRVIRIEEQNRLQATERELELTGAVQLGFLPPSHFADWERMGLIGFLRAADQASGDWWWYEEHNGLLTLLVGDVTGHGAGPAMVTAAVATAYRVQEDSNLTIEEKLDIMNREVIRAGRGLYHMTLSVVQLQSETGEFQFWSAGGQPVIQAAAEKSRVVVARGTPLGTDQNFHVGTATGMLNNGERILLFTDGIPEVVMDNGREVGIRRFVKMFDTNKNIPIEQAIAQMVKSADELRGVRLQDDDWTLVAVERHTPVAKGLAATTPQAPVPAAPLP